MTHSRVRSSVVAFVAAISMGARCDLVVEDSQTVQLSGGEQLFGFDTPNAVRVRSGGTLVVEHAEVFGRGAGVLTIPEGPFPAPGAAIEAAGGTVRILSGRIEGGNVTVQVDPNTFPVPAAPGSSPGAVRFAEAAGVPVESAAPLAPALAASRAAIEIAGGTLVSSSVMGRPNPYLPLRGTVNVFGGELRISGGEFLVGTIAPLREFDLELRGLSLLALSSDVRISGGNFDAAPVQLAGSRARITGGRFAAGLVVIGLFSPARPGEPPAPPPCYEIRGGSFSSIAIASADPLFIVGTQFNLPFGPVTSPPGPDRLPGPPLALEGVLEDGTPISLSLTAGPGTHVTLAPPGDPGCGT